MQWWPNEIMLVVADCCYLADHFYETCCDSYSWPAMIENAFVWHVLAFVSTLTTFGWIKFWVTDSPRILVYKQWKPSSWIYKRFRLSSALNRSEIGQADDFYARQHIICYSAAAHICYSSSICPSVCLSHTWIVSKWLNISSKLYVRFLLGWIILIMLFVSDLYANVIY